MKQAHRADMKQVCRADIPTKEERSFMSTKPETNPENMKAPNPTSEETQTMYLDQLKKSVGNLSMTGLMAVLAKSMIKMEAKNNPEFKFKVKFTLEDLVSTLEKVTDEVKK